MPAAAAGFLRDNPVVVTGVGLVSALGHSAAETWSALLSGQEGIRPIEGFDVQGFGCKVAAQVRGLGAEDLGIHSTSARIMDKHSWMLMKCARDAFIHARLDALPVAEDEIGFFMGMGIGDYKIDDLVPAVADSKNSDGALDLEAFYSRGHEALYPLFILSTASNISFCQVAIQLKIRGENAVFSSHADSGAYAIAESVRTLAERRARVVIGGGVSETLSPFGLARGHLYGVLDPGGDDGRPQCRPFGAQRRGTVLGEGCGVFALELRSSADKRGVSYAAMITGYGAAFESEQACSPPAAGTIVRAMRAALDSAMLDPSDIDALIAHGDGTSVGDRSEAHAIHEVFAKCLDRIVVFSSKGGLGHLLAGAPAVDAIIGLFTLSEGLVPPTLHCCPVDENVRFRLITEKPVRASPKRLIVNCRSDAGQCASLILEATG